MKIYRHIKDKKLYTIEHIIRDIRFACCGETNGIYAYPYNWKGENIRYLNNNVERCLEFVENNFEIVSEI